MNKRRRFNVMCRLRRRFCK